MKYSELEKKLKKAGCTFVQQGANHPIWYSPITKRQFLLSHHGSEEVRSGTLHNVKKLSGVKL